MSTPNGVQPESRSFRVLRMDDNGNQFEVAVCETRAMAQQLAATYEARGHKQTYWVEEAPPVAPGVGE